METIKNYLKYFKDVSFTESPFNDVDNAILSSLAYLDFTKMANRPITMRELGKKFFNKVDLKKIKQSPIIVRRTMDNFELLFNGDRYKNVIVSDYERIVDDEKQFCAMKFKDETFTYIAYEGTENDLVGWKEDFEMIYKFPVPAQAMAIKYINRVVKRNDKNLFVGGHSKGGNLAMSACMYARPFIKRRLKKVYNNDGPGFLKEQLETRAYKQMSTKLVTYIPEESMVGVLFGSTVEPKVLVSNGKGVFQHNINNWNCYGPIFIKGTLSENSKQMKKRVDQWLEKHDLEKRKQMVDALFEVFKISEITSIEQIGQFKLSRLLKLIKATKEMDKESQELVIAAFRAIFTKDDI